MEPPVPSERSHLHRLQSQLYHPDDANMILDCKLMEFPACADGQFLVFARILNGVQFEGRGVGLC